jgi:hypothetical protein
MPENEPVIEMQDYLLRNNKAETPAWLKNFKPGDELDFTDVFRTQSVFYPACGDDGRALKLFSRAHAAHLFYYVDSGMGSEYWKRNLKETPIDGYHILDAKEFSMDDLGLFSGLSDVARKNNALSDAIRKYCKNDLTDFSTEEKNWYFVIFERDEGLGDDHGVDRFAVAFVCEDAILWYAAFFAVPSIPAPTWLVDQSDMVTHGLFGRGEPLEQVADAIRKHPDYLLVSLNAEPWKNYAKLSEVKPRTSIDCSGKHWYLYKRNA